TVSRVIAATADGLDLEDVLQERRSELDEMAAKKLIFDTDPIVAAPSPVAKADAVAEPASDGPNATPQSGRSLLEQFEMGNINLPRAIREMRPPNVIVESPQITLNPPNIIVESPQITLNPPEVRVEPAQVVVHAPPVTVNPAPITVEP